MYIHSIFVRANKMTPNLVRKDCLEFFMKEKYLGFEQNEDFCQVEDEMSKDRHYGKMHYVVWGTIDSFAGD